MKKVATRSKRELLQSLITDFDWQCIQCSSSERFAFNILAKRFRMCSINTFSELSNSIELLHSGYMPYRGFIHSVQWDKCSTEASSHSHPGQSQGIHAQATLETPEIKHQKTGLTIRCRMVWSPLPLVPTRPQK